MQGGRHYDTGYHGSGQGTEILYTETEICIGKVLQPEEAKKLIGHIPDIPLLTFTDDKLSEQAYKECMKSNDCEELVKIIKTIYLRKQKRIQAGRKVTAVDAKYIHLAEESLYGELAVSLDMSRDEVEAYVVGEIGGR